MPTPGGAPESHSRPGLLESVHLSHAELLNLGALEPAESLATPPPPRPELSSFRLLFGLCLLRSVLNEKYVELSYIQKRCARE